MHHPSVARTSAASPRENFPGALHRFPRHHGRCLAKVPHDPALDPGDQMDKRQQKMSGMTSTSAAEGGEAERPPGGGTRACHGGGEDHEGPAAGAGDHLNAKKGEPGRASQILRQGPARGRRRVVGLLAARVESKRKKAMINSSARRRPLGRVATRSWQKLSGRAALKLASTSRKEVSAR